MLTALLDRQVMAELHGARPVAALALHGWGRSGADWREVLTGLDALALDLPGFGASPEPDEPWSVEQYASLLEPLVHESAPVVLVGHSFGGRVVARLAAKRPDLVRGIVLTGVPIARVETPRRKPAPVYRLVRTLRRFNLVSESRLESARRKYGSDDYRNASPVMRGVLVRAVGEDYSADLEALRAAAVPVRLVWGEADDVVPLTVAQLIVDRVGPKATLDVVPGSGHLLDPALSARVRAAIDSLVPGAAAGDVGGS